MRNSKLIKFINGEPRDHLMILHRGRFKMLSDMSCFPLVHFLFGDFDKPFHGKYILPIIIRISMVHVIKEFLGVSNFIVRLYNRYSLTGQPPWPTATFGDYCNKDTALLYVYSVMKTFRVTQGKL